MKINNPQNTSFYKRLIKYTIALLATLTLIAFAILGGAATPILNTYVEEISIEISKNLDKDFKVKTLDARVFPWLVFELEDVEVDDLLSIQSITIEVNTLRALLSFGEELSIDRATVNHVDLNLIRSPQGIWNFQEKEAQDEVKQISHKRSNLDTSTNTKPRLKSDRSKTSNLNNSDSFELIDLLKRLNVNNVYLKQFKVTVNDQTLDTDQIFTFANVDLEFPTLDPQREIIAQLKGQLLGVEDNFQLEVHVGPYDQWLMKQLEPNTIEKDQSQPNHKAISPLNPAFPLQLSVKADNIDLSLLRSFMPKENTMLSKAHMNGQITLNLVPNQSASLKGKWQVSNLKVNHQDQSSLVNIKLRPQLLIDSVADQTKISFGQTSLSLNDMRLLFTGTIEQNPKNLKLNNFGVRTESLTFDKLIKILPQLKAQLPPHAKLSGPIEFSIKTSGQPNSPQLSLNLDLNQSEIILGQVFHKPIAENLGVKAQVGLTPSMVKIKTFDLQLGQTVISTQGEIKLRPSGPELNIKTKLDPTPLKRLVRFLPNVGSQLNNDRQQVNGTLSLKSELSMLIHPTHPKVDFETRLSVGGANLNSSALKVIGTGGVIVRFKQQANGDFNALFDSNLSSLDLKFGELFQKPKGLPFDIELEVKSRAKQFDIPQFNLHLANLKLRGQGQRDETGFTLRAALPSTPLKAVLKMFGVSKKLGPDVHRGKLGFNLEIKAGLNPKKDLRLTLSDLTFKAPKSSLKASLKIDHPESPKVRFNLQATKLNIDRLLPPSPSGSHSPQHVKVQERSATNSNPSAPPPFTFDGSITVKRGLVRGVDFKDLTLNVSANEREVSVKQGELKVFDGSISFHPIKLKIGTGTDLSWSANLDLDKINLEKAQKVLSKRPAKAGGRMSGGFSLQGEGMSWADLSSSVTGDGRFKLEKGLIKGFDLKGQLLGATLTKLKQKIKTIKVPKAKKRTFKLKTIDESVTLKEGKIYFKEDLKIQTAEGPATFNGYIGLDGAIHLKSKLMLSAKRASQWLKTSLTAPKHFPISFTLGGYLNKPSVDGVAAVGLITAAAVAYGLSKVAPKELQDVIKKGLNSVKDVKKKVKEGVKKNLNILKDKASSVKSKAEDKVKAQADKAKREAKREAKKAKKEAKKRAKKAKNKAKKALNGLF